MCKKTNPLPALKGVNRAVLRADVKRLFEHSRGRMDARACLVLPDNRARPYVESVHGAVVASPEHGAVAGDHGGRVYLSGQLIVFKLRAGGLVERLYVPV